MGQILDLIIKNIQINAFPTLVIGGLIEQIIVPIPSPAITMAGGALFSSLKMPILNLLFHLFKNVSLPYSLGATAGTSLVYLATYFGGEPLIKKVGKYFGVSWNLVERLEKNFKKKVPDELFILLGISTPILPVSLISAIAGVFRLKPQKFYLFTFLALIIRGLILSFVGYRMGETYLSLANGLDKLESLFTILGVLAILAFFYWQRERLLKKDS